VAEWLGSALQKLLQRFESARYLNGCLQWQLFYFAMLTPEEEKFVAYWSVQRTKKRRPAYNTGFRLGVFIVAAIFISIVTGWHKRAIAALRSDASTILVIVIAAVLIVVFISLFAGRYQWEQREQRYKELAVKKNASDGNEASTF
jgi:uncharacterized membrane protein